MAINHAKSGEVVDLGPLGENLQNAKTTALVKSDAFEAVRLVVPAGKDIPSHSVSGPITLHCLEGRVVIGLQTTTLELSAGQWIYLNGGESHSLRGVEDASLLLTIIFPR
ncbi:cupin domain-containing protein [Hyphomicrobium sp.]|jgi:quercetin dioxygenase-like cupin family protein|uniref:cupin domain-containing protein n=1 Tax=Hyphomicrobium sp. TaxID=82 RepID=UPI002CC64252|nr:cupin domain-containing protein [Hyphomicrobium sp.]HVZ04023.1 cupin domain-containing protein [Hyphomicrobium sp.]